MESYYEMNVSFEGKHLFATAPRSARTREQAKCLLTALTSRFREVDGFKVTCTYWSISGKWHTLSDI